MSDALDSRRGGLHRRAARVVAAGATALVAPVTVLALTGGQAVAASPTPPVSISPRLSISAPAASSSPGASVLVTTTRSTVHAAGSTVPAWGLVFLVAVFVVAVALALPATRRRTAGPST